MLFARHYAEMSSRGPDGAEQRATWELAARRGNEDARRKLEGPDFPEELAYLWEWALELHGRSGVSMNGLVPMTYDTLRAWASLMDVDVTPLEASGLMALDAAMMSTHGDTSDEPATDTVARSWPTKKHHA